MSSIIIATTNASIITNISVGKCNQYTASKSANLGGYNYN